MDTYNDPAVVLFFVVLVLGFFMLLIQPHRRAPTVIYVPVEREQPTSSTGCLPLLLVLVVILVVLFLRF